MNSDFFKFLEIPELNDAKSLVPTAYLNTHGCEFIEAPTLEIDKIEQAAATLKDFEPYFMAAFPETVKTGGVIESSLTPIPHMSQLLASKYCAYTAKNLYLKEDSNLPIAGSIKARGGIYEIVQYAKTLALQKGLLKEGDSYERFASEEFTDFFKKYTVQVGSTGNLGLSIGIMSAKLGFKVVVHMSSDAKEWKKDLLRSKGVSVVEYDSDFTAAVDKGRAESAKDENSYFVDDEQSKTLFLGYSVAASRLVLQLAQQGIKVDDSHPLFVYLPCGIGGAPGGVAYGLKSIFGHSVHCFFTEPTHSPCMLLGVATGLHDKVCVQDFDIDGKTEADGLAVARPSALVGKVMQGMLSGIFTIGDEPLCELMRDLLAAENIFIEPSATAAFAALLQPKKLQQYIDEKGLTTFKDNITHIAWATGGMLVPPSERELYMNKNRRAL